MNRIECPACSSKDKKFKYSISGYQIDKCDGCSSMYVENVPASDKLLDQYKKADYYALPIDSEERINKENKRRANLIRSIFKAGNVLDIGCAKGSFLNEIKKSGYRTFGIEMSDKNVQVCRSNGHEVYLGDLDSYYSSDARKFSFEIITCLDVIEHIPEPKMFLGRVKDLLSDHGLLVLSTPNYSGFVSKVLGSRDPFLIPPEHLNFFTKSGLKELVKSNGFNIIKSKTFGFITEDGLNRTVKKYFPPGFQSLSVLLRPLINYSVKSLNLIKYGLELEFYLKNEK